MDQAYVTLSEAAELEGVGYDTFQKKVRRNPEKYSAKLDQRDAGGRELVFVSVDSLSKKARVFHPYKNTILSNIGISTVASRSVLHPYNIQYSQTRPSD